MLVSIGLIVGFYVLLRTFEIFKRNGIGIRIFTVIVDIVTILCIFDLLMRGTTSTTVPVP